MSKFFAFKIRGCVENERLHFKVGYFDHRRRWRTVVISGSLYKTFWDCEQAGKAAVAAVDKAYTKKWEREQWDRKQEEDCA